MIKKGFKVVRKEDGRLISCFSPDPIEYKEGKRSYHKLGCGFLTLFDDLKYAILFDKENMVGEGEIWLVKVKYGW